MQLEMICYKNNIIIYQLKHVSIQNLQKCTCAILFLNKKFLHTI